MRVYAVEEHSGSYEDYRCIIKHIFNTREKAESYIESEEKRWKEISEQSSKCCKCNAYWYFEEDDENVIIDKLKSLRGCDRFSVDNNKFMNCYICIGFDEVPDFEIEEYEIE